MRPLLAVGVLLAMEVWAAPQSHARPNAGEWISDETHRLSSKTLAEVNALASAVDAGGVRQLAVLVCRSVEGQDPRRYATAVFNHWQLGHAGSNEGVLLFLALDDRRAEIILGTGSTLSTDSTDVIMRDDVVANMKRGALDAAVLNASRSLAALLAPRLALPPRAHGVDQNLLGYLRGDAAFIERSPRSWVVDLTNELTARDRAQLDLVASDLYASNRGRLFFLIVGSGFDEPTPHELGERLLRQVGPLSGLPAGVVVVDLQGGGDIVPPLRRELSPWEQRLADRSLGELRAARDPLTASLAGARFLEALFFDRLPPEPIHALARLALRAMGAVGALIGLVLGAWRLKRWLRRRPRDCQRCHAPRQLLSEQADDAHLTAPQQVEEQLGSRDYDVWWCARCRDALVLPYGGRTRDFETCGHCKAKARKTTTVSLEPATYERGGTERVDTTCAACHHVMSFTRASLRLERSDSSLGGFSSDSGGSSSGSGSSGSW